MKINNTNTKSRNKKQKTITSDKIKTNWKSKTVTNQHEQNLFLVSLESAKNRNFKKSSKLIHTCLLRNDKKFDNLGDF